MTKRVPVPNKAAVNHCGATIPVLLEVEAPEGLCDRLAELVTARGYTLERGDCGGANGVTIYDTRTVASSLVTCPEFSGQWWCGDYAAREGVL